MGKTGQDSKWQMVGSVHKVARYTKIHIRCNILVYGKLQYLAVLWSHRYCTFALFTSCGIWSWLSVYFLSIIVFIDLKQSNQNKVIRNCHGWLNIIEENADVWIKCDNFHQKGNNECLMLRTLFYTSHMHPFNRLCLLIMTKCIIVIIFVKIYLQLLI